MKKPSTQKRTPNPRQTHAKGVAGPAQTRTKSRSTRGYEKTAESSSMSQLDRGFLPRSSRGTRHDSRTVASRESVSRGKGGKTSWGSEAQWYSDHLEAGDTYHRKVVLPNLLRVVDPKPGMKIFEIGCGEGFFSREFAALGAQVTASDISPELIELAKKKGGKLTYRVSPAENLEWAAPHSQDVAVAVLTLQNMEHLDAVLQGVARVLRKDGRFYFVLNHPAFRIPKVTSWGYDEATLTQYRRVDAYLTPRREKIDMHPGKKGAASVTYSYHRSLQDYMKALRHAGFAITRLEEWISHKTSEPGPRAHAENTSRREFPLFMLIEATRIH